MNRLEVAVERPVGDVVAELEALFDRVPEVESDPDAGADDLVLDVVDTVELLRGRERRAAVGRTGNGRRRSDACPAPLRERR